MLRSGVCIGVVGLLFAQPLPADEKYALLVDVSKYGHARMNETELQYPEADASAMADVLNTSGYTVRTLLGKQATQQAVNDALEEFESKGDADGVVVLGLFGHGVQYDDLAFYCPYDTRMRAVTDADGKSMRDKSGSLLLEPDPKTLVSMRTLLDKLELSGAGNKVLLADCCREDPSRARGLRGRAFGSTLRIDQLPKNCAALFACSKGEHAFEHKDWGHGAFTHALLKHCRMGDSDLTVNALSADVYRDVRTNVRAKTNGSESQTVNPIINGVVELKLTSPTKAIADLLGIEFVLIQGGPSETDEYDENYNKVTKVIEMPDLYVAASRVTAKQFAKFVRAIKYTTVGELARAGDVSALKARGYKIVSDSPDINENEITFEQLRDSFDEPGLNLTSIEIYTFLQWIQDETSVKARLANHTELDWIMRTHKNSLSDTSGAELSAEGLFCTNGWPNTEEAGQLGCYATNPTVAMKESFRLIIPIESPFP